MRDLLIKAVRHLVQCIAAFFVFALIFPQYTWIMGLLACLWAILALGCWMFLIAANTNSKLTALNCMVYPVERDDSYLSYYDQYGRLHQVTDGCNGCIIERAAELQRQDGVKLIRVELGRKNTGQL
jgi:hypothetical protein